MIFGSAYDLPGQPPGRAPSAARPAGRDRPGGAGMAVCGAGCMGFVNVPYGLRAIGYVEPDPLPRGPVALVTHSGSVFSAMLRTRRAARLHGRRLLRPGAGHHRRPSTPTTR